MSLSEITDLTGLSEAEIAELLNRRDPPL